MKLLNLIAAAAIVASLGSCAGKQSTETAENTETTTPQTTLKAPEFQAGVVNELEDADLIQPGTPVNKLTVIDFNAVWCGPCRQLTPVLEEMAKKYDGKVDFVSVDVDKFGNLFEAYNLGTSIPAVLILSPDGKSVSYIGTGDLLPADKFEAIIDNLLK